MAESTYGDYLVKKHKLDATYYESWVGEDSTYGTCWDEDGPTEELAGTPVDYNWDQYIDIIKLIAKDGSEAYNLGERIWSKVAYEDSDSEADYYGGCRVRDAVSIATVTVLNEAFKVKYNTTDALLKTAKDIIPEYFL